MITKVCGMREPENIRQVEQLGPDWMGFIFYKNSSRFVPIVPNYMPVNVKRVGVFVDTNKDGILLRTAAFKLEVIQLHGSESPSFVNDVRTLLPGKTIVKAFSIHEKEDVLRAQAYEGTCDYYLFDTKCETVGGSGTTFDWSLLDHYQGQTPFILSGGIGPNSLPALKQLKHPLWAGIDLNSKFETAPALKDVTLLSDFLQAFRTLTEKNNNHE